jgi:hypothetical protein
MGLSIISADPIITRNFGKMLEDGSASCKLGYNQGYKSQHLQKIITVFSMNLFGSIVTTLIQMQIRMVDRLASPLKIDQFAVVLLIFLIYFQAPQVLRTSLYLFHLKKPKNAQDLKCWLELSTRLFIR